MVIIYAEDEIETIRANARLLAFIVDSFMERLLVPGVSTIEIDSAVESRIVRLGGIPAFKGYRGYPCATTTCVNDQITNAIPSERRLQSGDLLKIQAGLLMDGVYAKIQHAYPIGIVAGPRLRLLRVTETALVASLTQARVGNRVSDVSNVIERIVRAEGYSPVVEYTGHGIGRCLHEDPQVPNYGEPGRGPRLVEGMVLQILPMINEGNPDIIIDDDGWTARTADGRDSCLMGHIVAIHRDGPLLLTPSWQKSILVRYP